MVASDVCIKRFADLPAADHELINAGIDEIFFGASFQTSFRDEREREQFRALWVGRYLKDFPELCLIALRDTTVAGYLAGYMPRGDTVHAFKDQHHMPVFADLHPAFPAHLHVNVHPLERSCGLGGQLVERFVDVCRENRCIGVHIVTGNGGRNNGFYRRLGFTHEVRRATENRDMIFMGRALQHQ